MSERGPITKSKYFVFTEDIAIPLVIIGLVVATLLVTFKSNVFTINMVECQLDFEQCEKGAITGELNKVLGQNLFTLQVRDVQARLTSGDFTIREVDFEKKYPQTLHVSLQSVYPVTAAKLTGGGSEWFVFDGKNRLIGLHKTDPNVPVVLVRELPPMRIGETVEDPDILTALDLVLDITSELPTLKTIVLESSTLELELSSGQKALMTTTKDMRAQIFSLQAMLRDPTMSKEVATIDVRFDKPVLKSK